MGSPSRWLHKEGRRVGARTSMRLIGALAVGAVAGACVTFFPGTDPRLSAVQGVTTSQAQGRGNFADFLAGMDLVVEGQLVSADTVTRAFLGGCGGTQETPLRAMDYRIQVSRVLLGTAEESTLVISALGRERWNPAALSPGARVIGWGVRNCVDGWRPWGGIMVITPGDRLVGSAQSPGPIQVPGTPAGAPPSYSHLESLLLQRADQFSTRAFSGLEGIALVRLSHFTRAPGGASYTYSCDSLGWVIEGTGAFPQSMTFERVAGCLADVGIGDTLIVPVPQNSSTTTPHFASCPRGWRVADNYVVGFGVVLPYLEYAISASDSGLVVNEFLQRGE